jgi:serine/threonine protein kinase
MADVLIARSTGIEGFERHVVLKRIRAEQARDKRFVEMFLDEARLAASLHHMNIGQVHDIGTDDGEYFFAMEYIHGEDLRKILQHAAQRDTTIPIDHIVTIVASCAAALHYAHEHRGADRKPLGLVHRDVSPANILIGYDGNVKVVDFGIAKATQRTTETHSGLLKGKVAYMSPEQCLGNPVDRRSDIFCLGIVLYELVTIRRLFKGANDFLTMSAITHGEIPRPSVYRPDIHPQLEAIILKALAATPEQRYQTADDMRAALEHYAAHAGLRTSTTALADFMRTTFGNRPEPWAADDDDEPELELSYDFDGSASGLVRAPAVDLPSAAAPGSPIRRARTKAITDAPDPSGALASDAMMERMPRITPAAAFWAEKPPAAAPEKRRSRKLLLAGTAVAVLAIALVVVLVMRANGTQTQTAVAAPRVEQAPPPKPAPVTPPNEVPSAPTEEAAAPAVEIVEPAGTVKKPKTTHKKKPPPKGVWDPNALFPKK